jgi:hypothetical protein
VFLSGLGCWRMSLLGVMISREAGGRLYNGPHTLPNHPLELDLGHW